MVASDGRLEDKEPASVSVLVHNPLDGSKERLAALIPGELLARWPAKIKTIHSPGGVGKCSLKNSVLLGESSEGNSAVVSAIVKGSRKNAETPL